MAKYSLLFFARFLKLRTYRFPQYGHFSSLLHGFRPDKEKTRDHGAARETHNNPQQRIKTSFEKTNSGFYFFIKEMYLFPSVLEQQEIYEQPK